MSITARCNLSMSHSCGQRLRVVKPWRPPSAFLDFLPLTKRSEESESPLRAPVKQMCATVREPFRLTGNARRVPVRA